MLLACERTNSQPEFPPPPPPPLPVPRVAASPHYADRPARRAASPSRVNRQPPPHSPRSAEGAELAARFKGHSAKSRTRGLASYYADSLAGGLTANGERYDPRAFTAAHRSLPFGSIVRVVREDSGQIVYARVNDRGPFVRGRVIDLSRAAAEAIDMIRKGVVKVRVEVVEHGVQKMNRKLPSPKGKGSRSRPSKSGK